MTIFLLIATLLTATVLFLVAKFWTHRTSGEDSAPDPEWQVLLEKRDEIESDAMLDASTRQSLREEWIKTADEVLGRHRHVGLASVPAPSSRKNAYIIAALTGLSAIILYMFIGSLQADAFAWNWQTRPDAISENRELPPPEGAKHPGDAVSLDERIANLENRLRQSPNDLDGWVLLARSHGIQRNFSAGSAAIEQALKLAPGHPDLMADLADFLAMTANRSLAGRPTELIKQVLQADPTHKKGLSLAATAAMQRNDLVAAGAHLRKLRASLPADSPEIAQIDAVLAGFGSAAAQNGMDAGVMAKTRSPASAAAETASIEGSVQLAPALLAKLKQQELPDQAVLFIVARSPDGPPMPVAVARMPAHTLAQGQAIRFKLDDSSAMSPSMKLSSLRTVKLEARISMSGTAGRQAGDMSGMLDNVDVGASSQKLLIDSIVQ